MSTKTLLYSCQAKTEKGLSGMVVDTGVDETELKSDDRSLF